MHLSRMLDKLTPAIVIIKLKTKPKATVVWIAFFVFSLRPAPISLATITLAPVEKPVKKPTNKKLNEPTHVTAANAFCPT